MPRRFLLVTCARCLLLAPVLDTGTTGSSCPRCGDRDVEAIPLTPPPVLDGFVGKPEPGRLYRVREHARRSA